MYPAVHPQEKVQFGPLEGTYFLSAGCGVWVEPVNFTEIGMLHF